MTVQKLLQRSATPVSDRWPTTYKSYVLIIVIIVENIGQTLKSYALSLNSPHQSNYAPKLRPTHRMHITQFNTSVQWFTPAIQLINQPKTCVVLSCSSDKVCAYALRSSQALGPLSVWHLVSVGFICVCQYLWLIN